MNINIIFLILAILFNASANILMKHGVKSKAVALTDGFNSFALSYLTNFKLMAGIICFGIALIFYSKTLEKFNLSLAYPLMTSSGILIVTIWSLLFLGEKISIYQSAGIGLIIGGIWLLNV